MKAVTRRIAIIGGGLGGLALRQALKAVSSSFQVTVYERDDAPTHRSQGYQIGIHGYGLEALKTLEMPILQELFERNPMNGVVLGGALQSVDPWVRFPSNGAFLVNRWKLRDCLTEGISESIEWNKKFDRYEAEKDLIRVYFTDGSSIECDLLVGADGAKSKVRQQYRSDLSFGPTGYTAIGGFVEVARLSSNEMNQFLHIVDGNLVRLQLPYRQSILCMKFIANNDLPHILWAISFHESYLQEKNPSSVSLSEANPSELQELLLQRLQPDVAQEIQFLLSQTPIENIFHQKEYYSMVPTKNAHLRPPSVTQQPTNRVTLLGDAAHAMTTHAGLGANTAFKDAIELAKVIKDPAIGLLSENWKEGHSKYEKEMFARGYTAVTASLGNTKRIHSHPSIVAQGFLQGMGLVVKSINYLRHGSFSLFPDQK